MNSKKRRERKQIITLGVTALVIVVLIVVYFIVVNVSSGDGVETQPPLSDLIGDVGTFTIIDEDYTRITSLSYKYGGKEISLHIEAGKWQIDGDAAFPVDQEKAVHMSQAISDYGGYNRLIYDESRASDYGTDDPIFDISATYYDSTGKSTYTRRYQIGKRNPISGRYYFHETGDRYIYMVSDAIFEYFRYSLPDLFDRTDVPTPEVGDIISLRVEHSGGEYLYDAEADTDVDISSTDSPVKRIMDAIPKSPNLQYEELIAYGVAEGKEHDLSEYGLDSPVFRITLKYKEYTTVSSSDGGSSAQMSREREFVILFGDLFTEGEGDGAHEYVYVSEEGSGIVYKAPASSYNEILSAVSVEGADGSAGQQAKIH